MIFKTTWTDKLLRRFLKGGTEILSGPTDEICSFSTAWKLYKTQTYFQVDPSNYRPISFLPFIFHRQMNFSHATKYVTISLDSQLNARLICVCLSWLIRGSKRFWWRLTYWNDLSWSTERFLHNKPRNLVKGTWMYMYMNQCISINDLYRNKEPTVKSVFIWRWIIY